MKRERRIRLAAAALGALSFFCAFARGLIPLAGELLRQGTLLSAAAAMPEGAAQLLRERYRAQLYSAPAGGEGSQAPAAPAPGTAFPAPSYAPSQAPEPAQVIPPAPVLPEIPERYRGRVLRTDLSGPSSATFPWKGALIQNSSGHPRAALEKALDTPDPLAGSAPAVLIVHTHATEAYSLYDSGQFDTRNGWRSRDNSQNTVAVGAALADALREWGLAVLHDTTQHDSPSYNGAYQRSRATVQAYLKENPAIRVVIDLHRDAIFPADDETLKPTAEIDGRPAAQLMLIACCDDGSNALPAWRENLRFAAGVTDALQARYPGLCRPVFAAPRHYNQDLAPGAVLLEVGTNANTLEEALYSARLAGAQLGAYLTGEAPAQGE